MQQKQQRKPQPKRREPEVEPAVYHLPPACRECGCRRSRILSVYHKAPGIVIRYHRCKHCRLEFKSIQADF